MNYEVTFRKNVDLIIRNSTVIQNILEQILVSVYLIGGRHYVKKHLRMGQGRHLKGRVAVPHPMLVGRNK